MAEIPQFVYFFTTRQQNCTQAKKTKEVWKIWYFLGEMRMAVDDEGGFFYGAKRRKIAHNDVKK